jgi:NitT/TauT family transport system substrate-binding protein
MRARIFRLVAVVMALSAIGIAAAQAEALKLRIGWVALPSELQSILFAHPGIARHVGQSYELEAIHFSGTPAMITALAAGELDIVPFAFSSLGTAIDKAGMDDLRIISDEFQDGVPGYNTNEYMVLKDSPIRSVEDLKGKVVASNAIGSALDMGLRAMLRKHGLEDKKDYTLVEVNFANMKSVLLDHKIDLISVVTPFSRDPGLREAARTLFTQKEAIGQTQMIIWVARQAYIAKHRAALVDFLEDYLRELHWYTDPANHREVTEILAKAMKLPAERFAGWVYTHDDQFRDPWGIPDLAALQANMNTQRELGFLKSEIDVRAHADLSLIEEAGKRLK